MSLLYLNPFKPNHHTRYAGFNTLWRKSSPGDLSPNRPSLTPTAAEGSQSPPPKVGSTEPIWRGNIGTFSSGSVLGREDEPIYDMNTMPQRNERVRAREAATIRAPPPTYEGDEATQTKHPLPRENATTPEIVEWAHAMGQMGVTEAMDVVDKLEARKDGGSTLCSPSPLRNEGTAWHRSRSQGTSLPTGDGATTAGVDEESELAFAAAAEQSLRELDEVLGAAEMDDGEAEAGRWLGAVMTPRVSAREWDLGPSEWDQIHSQAAARGGSRRHFDVTPSPHSSSSASTTPSSIASVTRVTQV